MRHWYVIFVWRIVAFVLPCLFTLGMARVEAASPWRDLAGPVFAHTDTRELPEPAVMSLAQDSAGFLWVGTQGGLARYDGYHFRSFLPNPTDPKALPDGYVRAISAAPDGGLWIGSSSNGLVRYDAASETFRTWRPDRAGRSGPRSASVDALITSSDGMLWIGGDGGLSRFDPRTGMFAAVMLPHRGGQPVVWSLVIDRLGTLWAGTQSGLYYRNARSNVFREYALGAARPIVYSLSVDRAGRLWAGSVSAVYAIDAQRRATHVMRSVQADPSTLAPGQQWAITEVAPGVIWSGTDSAMTIIDASTYRARRVESDVKNPGGLSGGRVVGFLRDRSGLVWLANHIGGLLLYNPMSSGLYEISATRPEIGFGDVGAPAVAAAPDGALWVGGFGGRLAKFAPAQEHPVSLIVPNRGAVQTLLRGSDGSLWIGTTAGLCRLPPGASGASCLSGSAQIANSSIYSLLEDGKRLWVGRKAPASSRTMNPRTRSRPFRRPACRRSRITKYACCCSIAGAGCGSARRTDSIVSIRTDGSRVWRSMRATMIRSDPAA